MAVINGSNGYSGSGSGNGNNIIINRACGTRREAVKRIVSEEVAEAQEELEQREAEKEKEANVGSGTRLG